MISFNEKYITDKKGEKKEIILPVSEWKKILEALEAYDDICAYDKAKKKPSNPIPFKQALKTIK